MSQYTAWHWLKDEIARLIGDDDQVDLLWAEYRARARLDALAARVRDEQRRAQQGNPRARRWLEDQGYRVQEERL